MRKILDKFKDRIVAITHKDIPPYDWQEAGYSNARAEAETDLKQEILQKLPKERDYHEENINMSEIENELLRAWDDGFNNCLAQVRKIVEEL